MEDFYQVSLTDRGYQALWVDTHLDVFHGQGVVVLRHQNGILVQPQPILHRTSEQFYSQGLVALRLADFIVRSDHLHQLDFSQTRILAHKIVHRFKESNWIEVKEVWVELTKLPDYLQRHFGFYPNQAEQVELPSRLAGLSILSGGQ